MANILVTNDDGVGAAGIFALAKALDAVGNVTVIAPERNWSAAGHPKTLHKPLRIQAVEWADGRTAYACSGAPSDCVALGLMGLFDEEFDLVVSGINSNFNLGSDVLYSGTVAGAMESIIAGVPAIAVSVGPVADEDADEAAVLELAGRLTAYLANESLQRTLPEQTLLNVNIPRVPPQTLKGLKVTRLGQRIYRDVLVQRDDPWGRPYYWIGGEIPTGLPEQGTDIGAIEARYASLTPLGIDLTNLAALEAIQTWGLHFSPSS